MDRVIRWKWLSGWHCQYCLCVCVCTSHKNRVEIFLAQNKLVDYTLLDYVNRVCPNQGSFSRKKEKQDDNHNWSKGVSVYCVRVCVCVCTVHSSPTLDFPGWQYKERDKEGVCEGVRHRVRGEAEDRTQTCTSSPNWIDLRSLSFNPLVPGLQKIKIRNLTSN